jgi:hypothetical protein
MIWSHRVDPSQLLLVKVVERQDEYVALSCGYAVVTEADRRSIAIEVICDMDEQAPRAPYYCPDNRLQRFVLPPRRVLRIRPYTAPTLQLVQGEHEREQP